MITFLEILLNRYFRQTSSSVYKIYFLLAIAYLHTGGPMGYVLLMSLSMLKARYGLKASVWTNYNLLLRLTAIFYRTRR